MCVIWPFLTAKMAGTVVFLIWAQSQFHEIRIWVAKKVKTEDCFILHRS